MGHPTIDIPEDGELIIIYAATVASDVEIGDRAGTEGDATWSSLPGVDANERAYADDDDALVTVNNDAAVTISAPAGDCGLGQSVDVPIALSAIPEGIHDTITISVTLPMGSVTSVAHRKQRRPD